MTDIKAMMLAFPKVTSLKNSTDGEVEEKAANFQRDYLRSMQVDALDDFYTDIKRHLWHLDFALIKNFQDVHDHIEQVRHDFQSQNAQLKEENEKLRAENEALKKSRQFYQV